LRESGKGEMWKKKKKGCNVVRKKKKPKKYLTGTRPYSFYGKEEGIIDKKNAARKGRI